MEPGGVSAVFTRHAEHRMQLEELLQMLPRVLPDDVIDSFDVSPLIAFIEAVVNQETGSMVVSRQLVASAVARLDGEGGAAGAAPATVAKVAYQRMLGVLLPRAISYEEQISTVRLKLAKIYETEGNMLEAANILQAIPLESGQRQLSPAYKVEMYLRIARLQLEGRNAEGAEAAISRAAMLLQLPDAAGRTVDQALVIEHKALHARVLDRHRRFVDAALKFLELSLSPLVAVSDQKTALAQAITCTILEQPGSQRTRLLTTLYKDERSRGLKIFGLLDKLYLDRIIKKNEFDEFERELEPHQRQDESGENIIRKMLVEHNLMAASKVYSSMTIESLAHLIDVSQAQAEKVAGALIASERLKATIDQIEGRIHFESKSSLAAWNDQIAHFCDQVTRVYDSICELHPELVAAVNAQT